MGKATPLRHWAQRRTFFIRFWGTFLAILALPSALLTILGTHWSAAATILLVVSALSLSLLVHKSQLANTPLPSTLDLLLNGRTYLRCPAETRLVGLASSLAEESYPPGSISPERFAQLQRKNPLILACLVDTHDNLLGYFDAIPLRPQFAQLLLRGAATEDQIALDDVLTVDEMMNCQYLFISGLAVRQPHTQSGHVSASVLVWGIMKYIERFYSSIQPLVFAVASTDAGDEILRRFRFAVGSGSGVRLDGYTLYQLRLSRDAIATRLECVPDWSSTCTLGWMEDQQKRIHSRKRKASRPRRRAYEIPTPLAPEGA